MVVMPVSLYDLSDAIVIDVLDILKVVVVLRSQKLHRNVAQEIRMELATMEVEVLCTESLVDSVVPH